LSLQLPPASLPEPNGTLDEHLGLLRLKSLKGRQGREAIEDAVGQLAAQQKCVEEVEDARSRLRDTTPPQGDGSA
jgi:hypothetical protein